MEKSRKDERCKPPRQSRFRIGTKDVHIFTKFGERVAPRAATIRWRTLSGRPDSESGLRPGPGRGNSGCAGGLPSDRVRMLNMPRTIKLESGRLKGLIEEGLDVRGGERLWSGIRDRAFPLRGNVSQFGIGTSAKSLRGAKR